MQRLAEMDTALFHWVNQSLSNAFFDGLMPLLSARTLLPVGLLMVAFMAWKMKRRGLVAVACLALTVGLGEALIISPLKEWIGRPRPPLMVADIRLLMGLGSSASMPSAHAANWFCATAVLGLFYRPSLILTLPLACMVSFSRVYTGVHYPSDVLVGAILGSCYGTCGVTAVERLWRRAGFNWIEGKLVDWPSFLSPGRNVRSRRPPRLPGRPPPLPGSSRGSPGP